MVRFIHSHNNQSKLQLKQLRVAISPCNNRNQLEAILIWVVIAVFKVKYIIIFMYIYNINHIYIHFTTQQSFKIIRVCLFSYFELFVWKPCQLTYIAKKYAIILCYFTITSDFSERSTMSMCSYMSIWTQSNLLWSNLS